MTLNHQPAYQDQCLNGSSSLFCVFFRVISTLFDSLFKDYGRLDIGAQPFSYKLFAKDAIQVLKQEGIEKAHVMGFSAGAITGTVLAAVYPQYVRRMVLMAGPLATSDWRVGPLKETREMEGKVFEANMPDYLQ